MNSLPWRLAIDFGTSNTAAAVVRGDGGVTVLRLGSRSDAIASCVAVYDGEILTGESALRIAGIRPSAFEPTPKRRLGENAVVLGGEVFSPVDLVASILRFVLHQAIRFTGEGAPSSVVLTHPDAWDEYMKQRLLDAAAKAGIPGEHVVLMPEPVAAAWHYAAGSDVPPGAQIAVLDFGGGTCDAAVLKFEAVGGRPAFHVMSSAGIDPLGGHDFDAQLENWVYTQLREEGQDGLLEALGSDRAAADRAVLRDQVREAKHALSFHGSAPIGVRSGAHEWVGTVTRGEFEQMIEQQLNRAAELLHGVIGRALPSADSLHRVYLTGGSSHIPALQAKLEGILPMKLGLMGDPKQVTSIGALQAPWQPTSTPISNVTPDHRGPLAGVSSAAGASFPDHDDPERGESPGLSKKVLIAGGVGAAAVILAVVFSAAGLGNPEPTPTGGPETITSPSAAGPSSPGATSSPPVSLSECTGIDRTDLSEGECALVADADEFGLFQPDSCTSNTDLIHASFGVVCDSVTGTEFSVAEQPTVWLYGYESVDDLNQAFDGIIDDFGAAERDVTQPPAWDTWSFTSDPVDQVRGRVLGAVDADASYLVWSEEDTLIEAWAISQEADVEKLYDWWQGN